MIKKGFLFLFIIVFLLPSPLLLASWQTHETEFFIIHFPPQLLSLVPYISQVADEIHRELMEYFQYEKEDKTHLILKDDSDFPGGYADPHLLDQIVINVSHPLSREFGTRYESWLRLVLAHEYGHILHLNLREGTPKGLRELLGKIPGVTTPNQYQPWWMLEGYAILAETLLTSGGRGDDSFYDMILRTAFLMDDVYYFDQIHGQYPLERWPTGGMSVYLYGASIFQYLADTYGVEKLIEVSRIFSSRPTGGINGAFYQVYGKNGEDLFFEWKEVKEREYLEVKEILKKEGITSAQRLTFHGYNTHRPLIHLSFDTIYYFHTGKNFPGLRVIDLKEEKDYPFISGFFAPTNLTLSPDGERILYARADYQKRENLFLDLYQYHLLTGKEERLTYGERARDVVETKDGHLIYVTVREGRSRVLKRDSHGQIETLIEGEEGYQYSQLQLSPSSDEMVLVIWKPGGFQDLYVYSFEKGDLRPLTQNRITMDSPSFTPDGEYILFSADWKGIYNLYAYQVEEHRFFQITNLLTGAFDPVVNEVSREIVFVGYSQEGFDVYQMPYRPEEWQEVFFPVQERIPDQLVEKEIEDLSLRYYNPLSYLTPRYIVPNLYLSTYGSYVAAITGGRDPLDHIHYNLTLEYEDGEIYYRFDTRLRPALLTLDFESSRERGRFSLQNMENYSLRLSYPLFQSLFHITRVGGGIRYRTWLYEDEERGDDYRGYLFLNRAWVQGRDTLTMNRDLLFQVNLDYIREEYYSSFVLDWRERFSLSWKESISLRGSLGIGERENTFALGGLYGNFPVRGYGHSLQGDSFYYLHGEYREVINSFKRGQGLTPIFYDNLSLAFFCEGGVIRSKGEEHFLMSYGGELSMHLEFFYGLMPFSLNLGLAKNYQEEGTRFYFSFRFP